ncbi:MAG: iron transporter [Solirubrobacteraceae bacterium]|jgi:uncharacterized protein involved in high-affinity Fe2+ transport
MSGSPARTIVVLRGLAAIAATAALAGCASANKTTSTAAAAASPASSTTSASGSMAGMNMSSGAAAGSSSKVNGIPDGLKPIPIQPLATAYWQGMKIQARAMTAVPFAVFDGTTMHMVKPTAKTTFHLMVMLNDSHTGVAIPYASVWATISKGSEVVYDERQWPMLSAYMGPHYGNNVSLPGPGTYTLSLLISPPVSARHVEYFNVWLHPHRVTGTFTWKPAT